MTRDDAHDLRHALSVILLWEQIARNSDTAETRAAALDAIRKAALEQSAVIDRLAPRRRPPARRSSARAAVRRSA